MFILFFWYFSCVSNISDFDFFFLLHLQQLDKLNLKVDPLSNLSLHGSKDGSKDGSSKGINSSNTTGAAEQKKQEGIPSTTGEFTGWNVYDVEKDVLRMSRRDDGKLMTWIAANLRLCRLNETYDLCKSYPSKLYAPATASDQVVQGCASFRSKQRLPMFSYVHENGATLW